MKRREEEEHAKSSFLKDGLTDCQAGKLERQSTIRIWSEAELVCRELATETIIQSRIIGNFKSSLEDKIRAKLMEKHQQKDQTKPPENLKDGKDQHQIVKPEPEIVPEGRKLDKELKIRNNTIKTMFANQHLKAEKKLEDEIQKEERISTKKRLELKWKAMKTHNLRMKSANEWLDEKLVIPVISTGNEMVKTRVEELVHDILYNSIMIGEGREKETRLEKARRRKEMLLRYLDRWWTTLGGGGCQI